MALFDSIEELIREADEKKLPMWKYIWLASAEDSNMEPEASWKQMSDTLDVMLESYRSYDPA